jgi:hypothetical protein
MASHKVRILALCKNIAGEHPGWQFIGGQFVRKVSKDAHFIIDPDFTFKGEFVRFDINIKVKLPKIVKMVKMVNSISHLKIKMGCVLSEQPNFINLQTLTGGLSFQFSGTEITPDELVSNEMHRWINVGGDYLTQTWPVEDYEALFAVMQKTAHCYRGMYGAALCCLAAYLGKFDFIQQFYAGELPHSDASCKLTPTDDNLLAILPKWQAQWEANGIIKV